MSGPVTFASNSNAGTTPYGTQFANFTADPQNYGVTFQSIDGLIGDFALSYSYKYTASGNFGKGTCKLSVIYNDQVLDSASLSGSNANFNVGTGAFGGSSWVTKSVKFTAEGVSGTLAFLLDCGGLQRLIDPTAKNNGRATALLDNITLSSLDTAHCKP